MEGHFVLYIFWYGIYIPYHWYVLYIFWYISFWFGYYVNLHAPTQTRNSTNRQQVHFCCMCSKDIYICSSLKQTSITSIYSVNNMSILTWILYYLKYSQKYFSWFISKIYHLYRFFFLVIYLFCLEWLICSPGFLELKTIYKCLTQQSFTKET